MPNNFSFIIPGKLAGMERPGKFDSLEGDLEYCRQKGIVAITSLTEQKLDVGIVEGAGFRYLHLPVQDFTPPSLKQIEEVVTCFDEINGKGGLLIHCGAGIGRTGTMLACILVATGQDAEEAIYRIRRQRPYSIETYEQERAIFDYQNYRRSRNSPPLELKAHNKRRPKSAFKDDTDPRKKSRLMRGLKYQSSPPTDQFKLRQDPSEDAKE